jgi:hypothetical protein
MSQQNNYLNNLNRPNLVDLSLLQKINDGYSYNSQPKVSHFYSLVQTAGSNVCSVAKDNIFISIIVFSLVLFLGWCYIEKQRLDTLTEKYLQKKLAKSLLNDELNLFTEIPSPLNVEKLFNDINTDINIEKKVNNINDINEEEEIKNIENMNQQNLNQERPVYMTKREMNIKNNDSNQNQLGSGANPNNMGLNQYPSQGFPKGAARDFGQDFMQQQAPPPIIQQPTQQQANQEPIQQQAPQAPQTQAPQTEQNTPQPIGGPIGSSKYMDISSGFNKNSYMLM